MRIIMSLLLFFFFFHIDVEKRKEVEKDWKLSFSIGESRTFMKGT